MHLTHTERFVVFHVENEWLVTYEDSTWISYLTRREEAETSAFKCRRCLPALSGTRRFRALVPRRTGRGRWAAPYSPPLGRAPLAKPN